MIMTKLKPVNSFQAQADCLLRKQEARVNTLRIEEARKKWKPSFIHFALFHLFTLLAR